MYCAFLTILILITTISVLFMAKISIFHTLLVPSLLFTEILMGVVFLLSTTCLVLLYIVYSSRQIKNILAQEHTIKQDLLASERPLSHNSRKHQRCTYYS